MKFFTIARHFILLWCFLVHGSLLFGNSHSFFNPRSITTNSAIELSDTVFDRYTTTKEYVHVYAKPFYLHSNNGNELARYFLPNNKQCAVLDELGQGDLGSLWFDLIAPIGSYYHSTISLYPERKAYGAFLSLYANLGEHVWIAAMTTPMKVIHNLNFCEKNSTAEGTLSGLQDACEAFNNPSWTAGKIPCHKQSRSGFDDVQLKIGYDFYADDCGHQTLYTVATIPTGKKITACTLFEPVIGTRHASFGLGWDGACTLNICDEHAITLLGDFKYRYLFSGSERRSFDLCNNGDWSRYLLVSTQQEPYNSSPGINIFTLPVTVRPRSTVDLWLAAHYKYCNWQLEVGYDFWWRAREKICLKCCGIPANYGIQTLNACSLANVTASNANISQAATGTNVTVNDATYVMLQTSDLNLNSGANPASHSSTIYGTIGYSRDFCATEALITFGGLYEFGTKNALRQWGVWITPGINF